jgi:hypothetical protein
MLENKKYYTGISFLPFDGSIYEQMPYEEITKEQFEKWLLKIPNDINLWNVSFINTVDNRRHSLACSGTSCEII